MCDFLDQPEWIRQQSQAGGNAVAYKRIQFRYNDIGQLTYVNRFETPTTVAGTPSLRTVLEHDDANRLLLLSHKGAEHEVATTLLNEYSYSYDFASRISSIDSMIDGSIDSMLDGLTQFSYSTSNQLTAANHDPSRPNENYLYDSNGNRIGTGFIVDPQNRTLSDGVYNYLYDHEGNRTQRTLLADGSFEVNTFDHRNRLTRVDFYSFGDEVGVDAPNQSVSYTYDAFQRMVRRTVDNDGDGTAELDQFFAGFDGDNSTLEFETAGGITAMATDLAHRRLYGPFIDQLIAQENVDSLTTAGETLWPLTDHTGTIRDVAVLDDGIVGGGGTSGDFEILSHRIFNSFGLLTNEFQPDIDPVSGSPLPTGPATSIDLAHGFTGRFHDGLTGLTHHQNRWFDPQLGKWISEDPLGFAAGDINTTRYVNNEPLTYTDPTGLIAVGITGGNNNAGHGAEKEGHHWVALGPVNQALDAKIINEAEAEYFSGRFSKTPHPKLGPHPAYNDAVFQLIKDFKKRTPKPTDEQLGNFVDKIMNSETGNEAIDSHNRLVEKGRGTDGLSPDEIRERGRRSFNQRAKSRGWPRFLGAASAIGTSLAFLQDVDAAGDVVKKSPALKRALKATTISELRLIFTQLSHNPPTFPDELSEAGVSHRLVMGFIALAEQQLDILEGDLK